MAERCHGEDTAKKKLTEKVTAKRGKKHYPGHTKHKLLERYQEKPKSMREKTPRLGYKQ